MRPYLNWSQMGSGAPPEDPVDGFEGNADWMGKWAVKIGKEAVRRGYRWAPFGFAGGDPEPGFWEAPGVLEYLRLCEQHPDQLGIALHEYSHVLTILGIPDKIGRFRQLHAACDKHGIRRPVIQIKEFGWEASDIPERDIAIAELVEVAKIYMEHPNVHGAAIWTVRPWQGSDIHNKVKRLIPHLKDAALAHAKTIPEAGPAVLVPPAPIPSTTPEPAVSASFGYVTANFLNFRSEPSAENGQASVITVLPRGTKVGILNQEDNGWLRVNVNNQVGFVYGIYIGASPVSSIGLSIEYQTGMNVNPDAPHSNPVSGGDLKGLNWVRFVFKVDGRVNPAERGDLDSAFAQYDPIIRNYNEQGINSLIIINQEMRHASPRDPGIDWLAFSQEFAKTAGNIAEHYKDYGNRVAYEIWNEGDLPNSAFSIYLEPEDYATLLRPTAKAIRTASPDSPIIFGGLAAGIPGDVNYVKLCRTALGGSLPVDAIGVHPYGRFVNQPPFEGWGFGTLSQTLDFYRSSLPGLKFWITEIGISGETPYSSEHYPAIAGYLIDVYKKVAEGYANLVPVTIWFAWTDNMNNAGILKGNGEKKAHIFEAFRRVRNRELFA